MSENQNLCPVCNEPAVSTCRCPRRDSKCKNGHNWHTCTVHHTLVQGASNHSLGTFVCTCGVGGQEAAVQPITPNDVFHVKEEKMPNEVIASFNELIYENVERVAGQPNSTFTQEEVVARMVEKGLNRNDIFLKKWLDIARIFEHASWEVQYSGENFGDLPDATYKFTRFINRD